jgi:hypothetical protein
LNVGLDGLAEKGKFIGPEIGVIALHVGIGPDMARSRRLQRQKILAKRVFVGRPIGPNRPPRLPRHPQALEGLDPVRMREHHAKAHGAAIVLHVKRVARKPERFGEINHDLGAASERVGEFFGSGQSLCPNPG